MKDIIGILQDMRRPRLLIQAARIGSEQYQRRVHLPRLLGYENKSNGVEAMLRLIDLEGILDEQRREKDASYSIARHVDVLSAMMGEARLLRVAREAAKSQPPLAVVK